MHKPLKIGDRVIAEVIGKVIEGEIADMSKHGVFIKLDKPHPLAPNVTEIVKHKTEIHKGEKKVMTEETSTGRWSYSCPECQSDNIQEQLWVTVNTQKIVGTTGGDYWCPDCSTHFRNPIQKIETKDRVWVLKYSLSGEDTQVHLFKEKEDAESFLLSLYKESWREVKGENLEDKKEYAWENDIAYSDIFSTEVA